MCLCVCAWARGGVCTHRFLQAEQEVADELHDSDNERTKRQRAKVVPEDTPVRRPNDEPGQLLWSPPRHASGERQLSLLDIHRRPSTRIDTHTHIHTYTHMYASISVLLWPPWRTFLSLVQYHVPTPPAMTVRPMAMIKFHAQKKPKITYSCKYCSRLSSTHPPAHRHTDTPVRPRASAPKPCALLYVHMYVCMCVYMHAYLSLSPCVYV
jgi:hypothetical protein